MNGGTECSFGSPAAALPLYASITVVPVGGLGPEDYCGLGERAMDTILAKGAPVDIICIGGGQCVVDEMRKLKARPDAATKNIRCWVWDVGRLSQGTGELQRTRLPITPSGPVPLSELRFD